MKLTIQSAQELQAEIYGIRQEQEDKSVKVLYKGILDRAIKFKTRVRLVKEVGDKIKGLVSDYNESLKPIHEKLQEQFKDQIEELRNSFIKNEELREDQDSKELYLSTKFEIEKKERELNQSYNTEFEELKKEIFPDNILGEVEATFTIDDFELDKTDGTKVGVLDGEEHYGFFIDNFIKI